MSTVRVMTEADVAAVSEIRVTGWKAAYAGIVPQSYLDRMTVEADAHQRRQYVTRPDKATIDLVAVDARGGVVGWACLGPSPTAAGELYALYVQPSLIGTGIGRSLLQAVHAGALARGFDSVLLWVLTDNTRARRFYERAGYAADGAVQADDYDGVSITEVRYRLTL
ncbi:GNAT family N-acetyltransferase [Streptomyces sp. DSM 40907]|uniref:GNAT family N-acetyltransferase n=1 Tax=Streptomyces kutzneri TaxID=3051179 RepID=UPI0028D7493F|nr:GNAT family N-acetyltransferase [Streptomyces sp. DSM 40907]